jgi:branched-chain amino acid transport system substrate-binding protein
MAISRHLALVFIAGALAAAPAAQTPVQVLKQCGDELTRENVMKQAANLKNLRLDLLLPGIVINTGPDDYYPIEQMQMTRFDGEHSVPFGPVISAERSGS